MPYEYGYSEEEKLGKPYDFKLMMRLYPYVKPYRRHVFLSIMLIVLITVIDLSLPYLTKIAIDNYIVPQQTRASEKSDSGSGDSPEEIRIDLEDARNRQIVSRHKELFQIAGDKALISHKALSTLSRKEIAQLRRDHLSGLTRISIVFFIVIIVSFGLNYYQVYLMEYTGQMVMHDLRMNLFDHVVHSSVSFFNRNPVGRLVTRTTNDVQNMNEMFTSVIVFVFKDLFLLVGIAVVLMGIDPRLALISFSVLPFVVIASSRFAEKARENFRTLRIKLAEINTRFSETIGGIKIVQLFSYEKENFDRFELLNHENFVAGMRQVSIFAVFMPVIELLSAVSIAIVIYFGGRGVIGDSITLGSLAAFISYMRMFFRPIRDIAEKYNVMQNAMASAERLFLLLDHKNVEPRQDRLPAGSAQGLDKIESIVFEDVSFSYVSGEPILKNLHFTVRRGETLAIVGPTGTGKTTLINLLVRFHTPTSGAIRINGTDIRDIAPHRLRAKMALVPQDPFLFSETIRENISVSDANPLQSDRSVGDAIENANLKRFIEALPEGIDTVLSEGGQSISSGQRQLISIARAFARNPELIILDEATSYIDSQTEQVVQAALTKLVRERTCILIAHRLSTARRADNILVLNRGRIMESGNHQTLMKNRGFYYRLQQLQQQNNGNEILSE